jgi:exodeoxyribonuclease V alpha subunit
MSETIKAKFKITKKVFQNNDFFIFGASPIPPFPDSLKLNQYFCITLKGELSYLSEGKEYELEVEELSTDKYGTSYRVVSAPSINMEEIEHLTRERSQEILEEITTSSQANYVLDAYENFIWLALTKGKEAFDLSKIYNVGECRLNAYIRELNTKYKYLNIMNKLKEWKLDISDCKKLIEEYLDEEHIAKEIQSNPYKVLISTLGRSFEFADRMIMELRKDLKVSEMRCAYLILSVLERNEQEGSTRLNGNDLYYYIMEEYNVPELEPLIVSTAMNNDLFYYDEKSKDLSIMSTYQGECKVADFVNDKISNSTQLDIDWTKYTTIDDFTMSEKQGKALEMFCKYNFMILAGYSGSGKTTSIRGIIKLMESNGMTYTLLAPTGKASRRITESVNRRASTIHRKALRDGEISTDVLIVDEMSMTDLPTFLMMLNVIENPNIRVVLVGDPAQLMPVGIGCVFNDLINSGKVPMITLDEIFRYDTDGGIFVATNVRQGKQFFDNDIVKVHNNEYSVYNNYKFVQTDNIFDTIVEQYNKLLSKGVKPHDILCLSPFNVGDEGSYKINNAIQAEVNPPKPNETHLDRKVDKDKTTISFRVGDKLLNKKNDYQALPYDSWKEIEQSDNMLSLDDVALTSVFNGQDGIIRELDDKKLVAQFDEELIVFDKVKLQNLLLAYCISVHASQGSEAKYVLNIVSPSHKRMLNRNLLYVADTRSKIMQIDIGDMATYNDALLIDGNAERDTWLKELMTRCEETKVPITQVD